MTAPGTSSEPLLHHSADGGDGDGCGARYSGDSRRGTSGDGAALCQTPESHRSRPTVSRTAISG